MSYMTCFLFPAQGFFSFDCCFFPDCSFILCFQASYRISRKRTCIRVVDQACFILLFSGKKKPGNDVRMFIDEEAE